MTSSNKKFIVMNRPSGSLSRDNEDKTLLKQFPNNFISILQYMIKHALENPGKVPLQLIEVQSGLILTKTLLFILQISMVDT